MAGDWKECFTCREIENALIHVNRKEYLQVYESPPLRRPLLRDLGLRGDGPVVQSILEGSYRPPPGIDAYTRLYLEALESPIKDKLGLVEAPQICEEDNIYDLSKTSERTSSPPLGLHYGLWKANSQD